MRIGSAVVVIEFVVTRGSRGEYYSFFVILFVAAHRADLIFKKLAQIFMCIKLVLAKKFYLETISHLPK